jgi:hypothetical protein
MKLLPNKLPTTHELLACGKARTTNNLPELNPLELGVPATERPALKDWDEPNWCISAYPGGHVIVTANRPSQQEIRDGELTGRWGSFIRLAQVNRASVRNALRIARRLCKEPARQHIILPQEWFVGIAEILTDLKVYTIIR